MPLYLFYLLRFIMLYYYRTFIPKPKVELHKVSFKGDMYWAEMR